MQKVDFMHAFHPRQHRNLPPFTFLARWALIATLADAILDRLVHNAYKITLQGDSMRKRQARLTRGATAE